MESAGRDHVLVFVEIASGSRNKYERDPDTGQIVLDRMLFTSMRYPADYGLIEHTLAEDGDPLDALVLVGEPTFPGCRIRARVVGLFRMQDAEHLDDKIVCVPLRDPIWSHVRDIGDLQPTLRAEIEHFFAVYKDLEESSTETKGFGSRDEALAVVERARSRFAGTSG